MPSPNPPGPSSLSYRVPPPVDGYGDSGIYPSPPGGLPAREERERRLLNWINERYREGLADLASQAAWPHIQLSVDRIYHRRTEEIPDPLSRLSFDQVKRDISEVVATFSNFRSVADYQCRNPRYQHLAHLFNELYLDFHFTSAADRAWRSVLQNGAVRGTGWISPRWTRGLGDDGEGRVKLDVYAHDEVVFIQRPRGDDFQDSYGCIIVDETPIARAHAKYPDHQDRILPDRQAPKGVKKAMSRLRRAGSIVFGFFGAGGKMIKDENPASPSVDIFSVYVRDQEINMTGRTLNVGGDPSDPTNSWAYSVPSFLDQNGERTLVPIGTPQPVWDPSTSSFQIPPEKMRPITKQECRLYPRGRLIVATRTAILWDGPHPYWHGRFPVAQVCFDKWAGELLGFPLGMSALHIEDTLNRLARSVDNASAARLNPPMESDDAVDQTVADRIVPSMPGQKWRANRLMGEGVRFPFPYQFYDVPQYIPAFIATLSEKIKELLGLTDARALARARQVPAADTVEKLLEMMGPIVEDRARSVETAVVEIGNQMISHFLQFYTLEKRLRVLGADGASWEDIDFDPANLIPSELPGATRAERGQTLLKMFHFNVTPRSLHEINSLSRRLLLLQLYRAGFPIDSQTLGEAFDIPQLGRIKGDTVFERYLNEQEIKAVETIRLQRLQAMMVPDSSGLAPIDLDQMLLKARANLGIAENGGHSGTGRKPSAQQSPQVVEKDGGSRTTVSESGR